ncbi:MAG: response regulator [Nitrospirae bacterium]|nr:response regulator [Nitrospirota bacterium]
MNEIELVRHHFSVLDQVPVGALLLKRDHTVLFWNSCLEDWTELPRTRIVGTDIREHFPHLAAAKFSDRLRDIFQGGPPTIFSAQIHGQLIPVRSWNGQLQIQQSTVTATPSLVDNGYYALLSIQDVTDLTQRIRDYRAMRDQALAEVTERKRVEGELLKAQEELEGRIRERTADIVAVNSRLQTEIAERTHAEEELRKILSTLNTLVEHIPEGVVLLDTECRIILANTTGKEYLKVLSSAGVGETLKNMSGMSVRKLFAEAQTTVWREITVSSPRHAIYRIGSSVIGQAAADKGMVLVIKDVTEEKSLQDRLQTQERLAAVGQLAAGIAHDFNNTLTGIIGFTEVILAESTIGSADREILEAVRQSGLRAAYLIRQILDFSRKSSSELRPMEMSAFLNEFSKFIRRTIQENISISLLYDPGEYFVRADPAKIHQVLTNIVLNARDAMPQGGRLTVSLAARTVLHSDDRPMPDMPDGNWVVLSVADTGCGMPSEILSHIFEPFFTTKETGSGTGLGLSQVYGIIRQHGGFIDVQSETGSGSIFTIYLPACAAAESQPAPTFQTEFLDGQHAGILVVEDYEAIRTMIRKLLTKLNFTVFTAENGKEALEVYEKNKNSIRLIITDLVMPELDGVGMSRIIKAKNPSVKILAISGYPLGSDWKDLYNAGITECIQKPFERNTLIRMVCDLLMKNN